MLHALSAPDIHLLRVFVAVVECGGFSAAQISLNVAQSTISTQMADLETRLGMRLCNRGRAGFSLTDDGRAVYKATKGLFRSIDQFTDQVNTRRGGLTGELRIAFADALVGNPDFLLEQAIRRFRERGSDVVFDLNTVNPLGIEQGVLEGRFHVGIHTFPSHAPGMIYRRLFVEPQALYCGRLHPLFQVAEGDLTPADVEARPYARRAYYGGTLQTGAFRPAVVAASADSMEALLLLILSGEFTGHLPSGWAKAWVRRGEIRPLLADRFSYGSQFEVVFRTGTQLTNLINAFLSDLHGVYRDAGYSSDEPAQRRGM